MNSMLNKRFLRVLPRIYLVLLVIVLVSPKNSLAQEQNAGTCTCQLAIGLQVLPITGMSVRANVDRFMFQVAGLPVTLVGIDEKSTVGIRVAYKLAQRSSYNVFVSTSVNLFVSRRTVAVHFSPVFAVERAIRADQLYAATVGAESFLGSSIALSGEAGIAYRRDGIQSGMLAGGDDGFLPMLGIGLHYYF